MTCAINYILTQKTGFVQDYPDIEIFESENVSISCIICVVLNITQPQFWPWHCSWHSQTLNFIFAVIIRQIYVERAVKSYYGLRRNCNFREVNRKIIKRSKVWVYHMSRVPLRDLVSFPGIIALYKAWLKKNAPMKN